MGRGEPDRGFEPLTVRLQGGRSTPELIRREVYAFLRRWRVRTSFGVLSGPYPNR